MILGDRLYNELDYERIFCITGALGGGKTRLAFDIALMYWRKGYKVISNVPNSFVPQPSNFSHPSTDFDLFNSFLVIDEGGEYVRKDKIASAVTRSASKANYYVIFAGKRLPHKNLQDVIIKPRFDFWVNYGIPLILWRAKVNSDEPYKFTFWQFLPQLVHGTFSTRTSSGGIEQIFTRAITTVEILAREEGQEAGQQQEAGFDGLADDLAALGGGAFSG